MPSSSPERDNLQVHAPDGETVPRAMCLDCWRPKTVCLCAHVTEVATRTRVVILQHERESSVPLGTARIAHQVLSNSELHVGVTFGAQHPMWRALQSSEAPPVLLFPGPEARDLEQEAPENPVTLVVIDGTWSQASKLLKLNPALAALPRYAFRPNEPSRYRIRRAPTRDYVCTIEAIVQALGFLEGPSFQGDRVLRPFDVLVEQQLSIAEARHDRRHLRTKTAPRRPSALARFSAREPHLIVGYGEANAWPRGTALGATPELVHWAAERIGTGERFEAYIAPRLPLSPSFFHHTQVPIDRVQAGEPIETFRQRWLAFVGQGDVLATWGYYATERLVAEGVTLPEHVDLRTVVRRHLRRTPGDVESCVGLLGQVAPVPWALGRTGVRLSSAVSVAKALIRAAQETA